MTENRETKAVEFLITDVQGSIHKAILVGVIDTTKFTQEHSCVTSKVVKNKNVTTYTDWTEEKVIKDLYLGLSITNPEDEYNFEHGFVCAKGRALKPNKRIGHITTDSRGMLNVSMVDVIMAQQIEFIRKNYELFFKLRKVKNDMPF